MLTSNQVLQVFLAQKKWNDDKLPEEVPVRMATWRVRAALESQGIVATCRAIREVIKTMPEITLEQSWSTDNNHVWRLVS